jgi:acetolactate synthase-1/2/3 large subunit
MRVADYIIEYLYQFGVKYIFLVPGGGAMYLNDAIAGHKDIKYIACHHEQAATMAAAAYAKYSGKLGVVCVTTGCGGTNTLTGVLDAYQDGAPILILSGQDHRFRTIKNSGLKLRQFGVQEANIFPLAKALTKYTAMVNNPERIKYYLDKALSMAFEGHPGPVWLDIPLDVQFENIDNPNFKFKNLAKPKDYKVDFLKIYNYLQDSKRPIIIVGQGVRLGKAIPEFIKFVEKYRIPVVSTKLGLDVLPHNHPLYVGTIGIRGDRAGNFALQNSDLVISLGARLSVCTTGYTYKDFAREAKKIVVDINSDEHKKNTIQIDLFIECDVKHFLQKIYTDYATPANWISKCQHWKKIFPTYSAKLAETEKVNLYHFMEILTQKMRDDDVIIGDAGSSMFVPAQGLKIRDKQRFVCSGGQTAMGFVIPACVGISFARDKGEVIGTTGDGSIQMNLPSLQTIKHHNLPVKLFVWNNNGYLTMRNTQNNYFKRTMAESPQTGVSFPDLEKIAYAYGIKYLKVTKTESLPLIIDNVLMCKGPIICEVMCLEQQQILGVSGKQLADGKFVSRPFEDMSPFLSRKVFFENMIVKPLESSYE